VVAALSAMQQQLSAQPPASPPLPRRSTSLRANAGGVGHAATRRPGAGAAVGAASPEGSSTVGRLVNEVLEEIHLESRHLGA
jgi:hypothetical protein